MALNLLRNSRVFFTTNVNTTTGVVQSAGHTTTTTYEIQVLEGFSFSQNSNSEAITVSEAGTTPARGQRSFNTSLAPVDFNFSTYIRPYLSTNVKCEESVLWNALAGNTVINTPLVMGGSSFTNIAYTAATNLLTITGGTMAFTDSTIVVNSDVVLNGIVIAGGGTAAEMKVLNGPAKIVSIAAGIITLNPHNPGTANIATTNSSVAAIKFYRSPWSEATTQSIAAFHDSNKNQLQKFGMYIVVDNVTYQIDNAAMSQATIDFGLDGIAMVAWTGQATALTQIANNITTATPGTLAGGTVSGNYTQKVTTAPYITNKLSTATLKLVKDLGAGGNLISVVNGVYYVALTGGSITINNNITYITPANLGTVNLPAVYFTGTRAISGSVTAYLNTGSVTNFAGGGTGNLLRDMLAAAATAIEPMFAMEIAIGGSNNALKVELQMPSVSIAVPTIDAQAVMSTSINFTAAASALTGAADTSTYDLSRTNDLTVRYYAT